MDKFKKINIKSIYEILMAVLSIIVVVMLILEVSYDISENTLYIFNIIDNIILFIFITDYIIRFYLSPNKLEFFKRNIIDLIAIIPFNSVFQGARILRLSKFLKFTKLIKLLKLFRALAVFLKFRKHIDKFLKTNNFHYVIFFTITTLFIGTIGIHFAEGISYENAIWWSFVTITTVGYGDISPSTSLGRVLASFLMLVGIGFLSMLTGTISTFFLTRNNKTYKAETIKNIQNKLDNFEDLSPEDLKDIYQILLALKNNE